MEESEREWEWEWEEVEGVGSETKKDRKEEGWSRIESKVMERRGRVWEWMEVEERL